MPKRSWNLSTELQNKFKASLRRVYHFLRGSSQNWIQGHLRKTTQPELTIEETWQDPWFPVDFPVHHSIQALHSFPGPSPPDSQPAVQRLALVVPVLEM